MKCPYNTKTLYIERSVPRTFKKDFSDDPTDTIAGMRWDTTYFTQKSSTNCSKEECGAWQNGHCVRTA